MYEINVPTVADSRGSHMYLIFPAEERFAFVRSWALRPVVTLNGPRNEFANYRKLFLADKINSC